MLGCFSLIYGRYIVLFSSVSGVRVVFICGRWIMVIWGMVGGLFSMIFFVCMWGYGI